MISLDFFDSQSHNIYLLSDAEQRLSILYHVFVVPPGLPLPPPSYSLSISFISFMASPITEDSLSFRNRLPFTNASASGEAEDRRFLQAEKSQPYQNQYPGYSPFFSAAFSGCLRYRSPEWLPSASALCPSSERPEGKSQLEQTGACSYVFFFFLEHRLLVTLFIYKTGPGRYRKQFDPSLISSIVMVYLLKPYALNFFTKGGLHCVRQSPGLRLH